MKIEDQVCSLKSAKKLKELGIKQKSLLKWSFYDVSPGIEKGYYGIVRHLFPTTGNKEFSAFTVAELGEMLPVALNDWNLMYVKRKCPYTGAFKNHVLYNSGYLDLHVETKYTEAEARAKMIIYLIENGYVKIKNGYVKVEDLK